MGCTFYITKKCVLCTFLLNGKPWHLTLTIGNTLVKHFKLWIKKKTSHYKSFITINDCVNCIYAAMPLRVGFCVCVCRWCPSYWVTWGWTRWEPALTGGPSVCIPAPKTVTKATSINMSTCGNKTILSDPMKRAICS